MNKGIQKNLLKILSFTIVFIAVLLINKKIYAKSYTIDNMDIQAEIQQDGSININQKITYNFVGNYNGIYITIPYLLEDSQAKEVNLETKDYSIYNGNKVTINKIIDSQNVEYIEGFYVDGAVNVGIYTVDADKQKYKISVYSPSKNTTKTFTLNYSISNVCVKHNDVAELYYNFIGGEWDVDIKKLNIDVILPNNQSKENLYAFGHGPYNGVVTIESPNKVNFKVNNVKKRTICSNKGCI